MRRTAIVFTLMMGVGLSAPAAADAVYYVGPHPISPAVHDGMCEIEGPHVHSYRPHKPVLYLKVHGRYTFVGDPTEFGGGGPKYAYHSHHPVFWIDGRARAPERIEHYCYISGPHHHWYAPPPEMAFELKGGVHWYVGDHPKWYKQRYRRHRDLDRYYAQVEIVRPEVTVEPPAGFVTIGVQGPGVHVRAPGVHVHGPGVRVGGGVHVAPPAVGIDVRVPSIGVRFGGGPVAHEVRHRKVKIKRRKYRSRGDRRIKIRGGGRGRVKIKAKRKRRK